MTRRGGARVGAGRPATGRTVRPVQLHLPPDAIQTIDAERGPLSRSQWVTLAIIALAERVAGSLMTRVYQVRTVAAANPSWSRLCARIDLVGSCSNHRSWIVTTDRPADLEAALEADPEVIEYTDETNG